MTLLQKTLISALSKRKAQHMLRRLRPFSSDGTFTYDSQDISDRHKTGRDPLRKLIDLSSNDYLGLSHHPALKKQAADWAIQYGTGARASRLVSGTLPQHRLIEEKLADFKKSEAALLFSSGWQANASLLPALAMLSVQETGHPATFFMDKLNHASLYHGCRAAEIVPRRFRHNDLTHLEDLLKRDHAKKGLRFIFTESVFSMDGDCADMIILRALSDRYGAFLVLDEAHATGILGQNGTGLGQGLADITMSTASKALGGMGAFITGSQALCTYLLNYASGLIYSTALPPPVLGALDAALTLLPALEKERQCVRSNAQRLRHHLACAGYDTGASCTQIIPVMMPQPSPRNTGHSDYNAALNARQALILAKELEECGFLSSAIRPPTVPPKTARLRLALNSTVTQNQVDRLADCLINRLSTLPNLPLTLPSTLNIP